MADPSATNHTAESRKAVAAFSSEDMTDYTDAHPGGIRDTTDAMPISPTESNAAARTIGSTERGLASTTGTVDPISLATLEAKPWPRLHLLGIPRELRDQIYKYAIVSDKPVNIGSGGSRRRRYFFQYPSTYQSFPPTSTRDPPHVSGTEQARNRRVKAHNKLVIETPQHVESFVRGL